MSSIEAQTTAVWTCNNLPIKQLIINLSLILEHVVCVSDDLHFVHT